jgi:hypothetical protein
MEILSDEYNRLNETDSTDIVKDLKKFIISRAAMSMSQQIITMN